MSEFLNTMSKILVAIIGFLVAALKIIAIVVVCIVAIYVVCSIVGAIKRKKELRAMEEKWRPYILGDKYEKVQSELMRLHVKIRRELNIRYCSRHKMEYIYYSEPFWDLFLVDHAIHGGITCYDLKSMQPQYSFGILFARFIRDYGKRVQCKFKWWLDANSTLHFKINFGDEPGVMRDTWEDCLAFLDGKLQDAESTGHFSDASEQKDCVSPADDASPSMDAQLLRKRVRRSILS